ncbi:MAG TPA: glycosyltransferase family 39 protein, partial [Gemmatimonadales bacterium]|nr:glycosyltransferase family 39 protein [Gemmatimonadales bacterium]
GGRMYSPFPPGWPAALAVGSLLHLEWLINPLLGALNLLLAWALLVRLYDGRTARLGALLLAVSPWYLFLAMSFMAHQWTLTCALLAALGVIRARQEDGLGGALLGGLALGAVTLVRPLDGVILGVLLGLWVLGVGGRRLRLAPLIVFGISAAAVTALNFAYNRALTGHAATFPVMAYFDRHYAPGVNALGFGPNRGLGWRGLDPLPGHGPADVVINTLLNLFATNVELFGWGAGSLLFAAVAVFSPRRERSDHLLLSVILAVIAFHGLYWFSGGPDFGARYWFLTIVPLAGLTARGLQRLEAGGATPARIPLAAVALSLVALLTFVPWRALDKYRDYRGMRPGIRHLATTCGFGSSLVLVQGRRFPDYASAAAYNALPPFGDGPIYAWDRSPEERDSLHEAFPDRPIWVVAGPTVTGAGYRVVAAPTRTSNPGCTP